MIQALISGTLAHGGLAGAIAEMAIALAVLGFLVAIWFREWSARRAEGKHEVSDWERE